MPYSGCTNLYWPNTTKRLSKSKALQLIWWVTQSILGLLLILIVNPVLKEMGLNQAIQSQILFRGKQPNKKGISYTLGWFISAPELASIVLFLLLNWELDLRESKVICGFCIFVLDWFGFGVWVFTSAFVYFHFKYFRYFKHNMWPAFVYFYVKYLCGLHLCISMLSIYVAWILRWLSKQREGWQQERTLDLGPWAIYCICLFFSS